MKKHENILFELFVLDFIISIIIALIFQNVLLIYSTFVFLSIDSLLITVLSKFLPKFKSFWKELTNRYFWERRSDYLITIMNFNVVLGIISYFIFKNNQFYISQGGFALSSICSLCLFVPEAIVFMIVSSKNKKLREWWFTMEV